MVIFGDMLGIGWGECIGDTPGWGECIEASLADPSDGSYPGGFTSVLRDKTGILLFIFNPRNAEGCGLGGGFIIFFGGEGPTFGLVGANALMPSLCFTDIPLVGSEEDMSTVLAWGLSERCESFMLVRDGMSAATLVLAVGTADMTVLLRGTSGEDGTENKDVWEAAGEKMVFTRSLLSGTPSRVNSVPLLP